MRTTATVVLAIMREELRYQERGTSVAVIHRVIALVYGFGPKTVATTWNLMFDHQVLPKNSKVEYFLRTLHYMKSYEPFDAYTARYRTTHTTFRKWVRLFTEAIVMLKDSVVSNEFRKRKKNKIKYIDYLFFFRLFSKIGLLGTTVAVLKLL